MIESHADILDVAVCKQEDHCLVFDANLWWFHQIGISQFCHGEICVTELLLFVLIPVALFGALLQLPGKGDAESQSQEAIWLASAMDLGPVGGSGPVGREGASCLQEQV